MSCLSENNCMRLAIHALRFSPSLGKGASESLALFIRGFRQHGIESTLYTYYSEDNSYEKKPCEMHEENFKGSYLALQRRIALRMRESGADVHLLFGPSVMWAGGFYKRTGGQSPVAIFINNYTPGMMLHGASPGENKLSYLFHRIQWYAWEKLIGVRAVRGVETFIFDSPVIAEIYGRFGYRARSSDIIPDPLDLQRIALVPAAPTPFSREPGSFHCVYAGRLIKDKGVDVLIEAARTLPRSIVIHIVGSGNEEAVLRHSIEAAGLAARVCMHGWKRWDELIGFYRAADCFVHPSRFDSFGRAVAEALACGTPVITADKTGPAWVADGGGITFKKGDAEDLARCILFFFNDPEARNAYAKRALGRAQLFDANIASRQLIAAMESLAGDLRLFS